MDDIVLVVACLFQKACLRGGEAGKDVVVERDGFGGIEGVGDDEAVCAIR